MHSKKDDEFYMMKKIIAIIFSLAINGAVYASSSMEDVDGLVNAGKLEQALKTLDKIPLVDQQTRVKVAMKTANVKRLMTKHYEALSLLEPLISEPTLNLTSRYELHKEIGINYRRLMKLEEAEYHYLAAQQVAVTLNDNYKVAQTYSNLGVMYEAKGFIDKAMDAHLAALERLKQENKSQNSKSYEIRASNFYNLGAVAMQMRQQEQAIHFFEQALVYDKKSEKEMNIASTALRLATLSAQGDNPQQAIPKLNEAIEYLKQLNAYESLAQAYGYLHQTYKKLGNKKLALENAKLALEYAQKTDSTLRHVYSYLYLSDALLATNETQLAETYLQHAKPLVEELNLDSIYASFHFLMAKLKAQHTDFSHAYDYMLSNHKYESEIALGRENKIFMEQKKRLDNLVRDQKVSLAEKQNSLAQAEVQNQTLQTRIWLLASIIIALLSSIVIYLYYIKQKNAQYHAKMYQSNLAQKEQMLADISHELRTPLSVLKLHIEALEHNLIDDKLLAYGKINDKISQLNTLISDVYQLSQVENNALHIQKESFDLSELSKSYLSDLKPLVEEHELRFISDIDDLAGHKINTDKSKLDQIILNLAKNACLYTDSPGHVRFKMRATEQQLFIQIDDTSPGVSKNDLSKLFERLYRVDKSRSRALGGSGLGLSICQSLTQALGGNICLHHGKSGGLCVRILLPLT